MSEPILSDCIRLGCPVVLESDYDLSWENMLTCAALMKRFSYFCLTRNTVTGIGNNYQLHSSMCRKSGVTAKGLFFEGLIIHGTWPRLSTALGLFLHVWRPVHEDFTYHVLCRYYMYISSMLSHFCKWNGILRSSAVTRYMLCTTYIIHRTTMYKQDAF